MIEKTVTALLTVIIISGCSRLAETGQEKVMMSSAILIMPDTTDDHDIDFLTKMADNYLESIRLSRLASTRGSATIKKLGEKIESEKLLNMKQLESLAASKLVLIPQEIRFEKENNYFLMYDKEGAEFDKAFFDLVEMNNRKTIEEFRQVIERSRDEDIRDWALKSLPGLESQMQMLSDARKNIDNKNR